MSNKDNYHIWQTKEKGRILTLRQWFSLTGPGTEVNLKDGQHIRSIRKKHNSFQLYWPFKIKKIIWQTK